MNNLAIIPARGRSKRIPRKNTKSFLGKPVIIYSIEAAIKSNLFDEVIVSTDDEEIAEISIKNGAKVPFFRSKENSSDNASTFSVIKEVIENLKKTNCHFKNVCCIYPCSPLIKVKNIIKTYDILINENRTTVFPIVKYSTSIHRALIIQKNKIKFLYPENKNKRTQDFIETYYDAGQFYWLNIEETIKKGSLISDNSGSIELNEMDVQDIDNWDDFNLAEIKYKISC